jgi:hypothetical protein
VVNVSEPIVFWQAISDRTAVAWTKSGEKGGAFVYEGPVGLVMWGDISWEGLQGIGLSRLSHRRTGYPEWVQPEPPSHQEIQTQWALGASARAMVARRPPGRVKELLRADLEARRGERLVARQSDEMPDSFYRRVANFYKATMETGGKPTTAIAESAGVPKTTAARWVREARQRNFLPPTTKGRSRS